MTKELIDFIYKIEFTPLVDLNSTQVAILNACSPAMGNVEKESCYRGFLRGLSFAAEMAPEVKELKVELDPV